MTVEFTKAHGNGNDFVIVDEWGLKRVEEERKSGFAARYCDRRRGIGGDGVVFLSRGDGDTDARMRLFQPDGDPVEMCGNALRCVARFCVDRGYFGCGESFLVGTGAGEREVCWDGECATVEMGAPSFDPDDTPVLRQLRSRSSFDDATESRPVTRDELFTVLASAYRIDPDDVPVRGDREIIEETVAGCVVTAVNTGVPHAVTFVNDVDTVEVEDKAPSVRGADVFPEGANVNFVEKEDLYRVRTFERGVEGETSACGTGAVAVAAVARRLDGAGEVVRVGTRGGELVVEFEDDLAYLSGDAELVYEGKTRRRH